MAINQRKSGNNVETNNELTWWLGIKGIGGKSVAFNLSPIFENATHEQVEKILKDKEVHISCFNKVSIKIRGKRNNGSYAVFGYLNNYNHGLTVDCDDEAMKEVYTEITEKLDNLESGDITQTIGKDEAQSILDNL